MNPAAPVTKHFIACLPVLVAGRQSVRSLRRLASRSYRSSIRAVTAATLYSFSTAGSAIRGRWPALTSAAIAARIPSAVDGTRRARSASRPSSAGQVVYSTGAPLASASSTDRPNVSCFEDATNRSIADSMADTSCRSPAKITWPVTPCSRATCSRCACSSPLPTIISLTWSDSSAEAASMTMSNCLFGSSRPRTPIRYTPSPTPNSARTRRRAVSSNATRCRSTPFGMTVTRFGRTPHFSSRSRTVPDTAIVMSDSSSVPRYRVRTPSVIRLRSRCVSPIECSVLSTTGVPASQAADRPYTWERYRCACTTSYPPSRISARSRSTVDSWVLLVMPTSRTRPPSSRIMSATGPGL